MVDAVGTTRYSYNAAGQLLSEDGPWADDTVTCTYTNRLRASLSLAQPSSSPWTVDYGYDGIRRLQTIGSPAGVFGYEYLGVTEGVWPASLVSKLTLPGGAFITNSFDNVARLLSTSLQDSQLSTLNAHQYAYNPANQRTQQVFTAANFVDYTYDNIGQLKTALGKEAGGTTNRLNEQLGYAYDPAGNLNFRTNNALVQDFRVNSLNELTNVSRSGTLTVEGMTSYPATNVTVYGDGLAAGPATLYGDNTWARTDAVLQEGYNAYGATAKDASGRSSSASVSAFLPSAAGYLYDLNGNLLSDGRRWFEYDDENQLRSVTVSNSWRSEFVYDGKMRRRIRREYTPYSGGWRLASAVYYVYDGNLVLQERNTNNVPQVTYTRGKDLSGSLEGAGGIGGLLARTAPSTLNPQLSTAYYHADGNGNITALININALVVAKYVYDPYGNILGQSGDLAATNLYRFSSKEFHVNSGLVYYLYRFYEPNLQRWMNRDPIEELGDLNLYGFLASDPVGHVDALGLQIVIPIPVRRPPVVWPWQDPRDPRRPRPGWYPQTPTVPPTSAPAKPLGRRATMCLATPISDDAQKEKCRQQCRDIYDFDGDLQELEFCLRRCNGGWFGPTPKPVPW